MGQVFSYGKGSLNYAVSAGLPPQLLLFFHHGETSHSVQLVLFKSKMSYS